jgi:folate-dependent phosphoribosylglycinamide formyltransferase PurN
MVSLTPLVEVTGRPMRVAVLISGSGTNFVKLLEHQEKLTQERGSSPYEVVAAFADRESKLQEICKDWSIPGLYLDVGNFCRKRGKPRRDPEVRAEYDGEVIKMLEPYEPDFLGYAGYLSVGTPRFVNWRTGVNVHPAPLTVLGPGGDRKYKGVGLDVMKQQLRDGVRELMSTTHIVRERYDEGEILMESRPFSLGLPMDFTGHDEDEVKIFAKAYLELVKRKGDWDIFPRTVEYMADQRLAHDGTQPPGQWNIYFDGKPVPNGVKVADLQD